MKLVGKKYSLVFIALLFILLSSFSVQSETLSEMKLAGSAIYGSCHQVDFDHDGDVDGLDLVTYGVGNGISLEVFAAAFGLISCSINSEAKASAFLSRTTFGPKMEEIEALAVSGDYNGWIDAQFTLQPSYHLAWMSDRLPGVAWKRNPMVVHTVKKDAWWDIAVNGSDQLRQRVAFALSEIMVVSQFGPLVNCPDGLATYYDILVQHAFGNFRDLIEAVTLNPMMGRYLSYQGNAKADPAKGNHPDENYAREVMQLFTIGLFQLNQDGSTINNPETGIAYSTYVQNDIREMAKVFTGWTNDNGYFFFEDGGTSHHARTAPMVAVEEYHETSAKQVLGITIPPGQTAKQDLDAALNLLCNHSNVGPFIGRQLIQRLVTSNPSPQYVGRVAGAFNDNSNGERGDLKAVVKAILLDPEALAGYESNPQTFGKVREPLLCISNLWRAYHAENGPHTRTYPDTEDQNVETQYNCFNFHYVRSFLEQNAALESLTVFNYFTPDDGPAELIDDGLVAPEMTVLGIDGLHHVLMSFVLQTYTYDTYTLTAHLDVGIEISLLNSGAYDNLIERLNILLMAGTMTSEMKQVLFTYIENHIVDTEKDFLARNVIALVMTSAEYAVQR